MDGRGTCLRGRGAGWLAGGVALLWMAVPLAQQCPVTGCDDGNPCTDDLCDATLGCRHYNNSSVCSDGNACTSNDVCNGGVCVGGNVAAGCSSCDAVATIPPQGGVFSGTTSGSGSLNASCGSNPSGPERIYRWTPRSSGPATLFTCGSATRFDSVIHLRSAACGGPEVACNDDACATGTSATQGSRLTPTVTAGQTYYIVVDGYNDRDSGAFSLTVQEPAVCGNGVREGGEICDGADADVCVTGQCSAQCSCVAPAGGLPDLRPEIQDWKLQFGATVDPGDVAEGCAESASNANLLRFGVRSWNVGTSDLYLGDPQCPDCLTHPLEACVHPDFTCSPSQGHNHAHYGNYARYELLDATSQAVVVGHKQGFCLMDTHCASPVYTCENQGLSMGCYDLYPSSVGCQYLDITDVLPGNYTLRVTMDPFGRIDELDETNNVVSMPVTIPDATAAACSSPTVVPAVGGVFTGTTAGGSTQSGSCGGTTTAPEKAFEWTPAVSGTATIQTCGSSFNTVLYMRGDSCGSGSQLVCNNDAYACPAAGGNYGSRIARTVTAGRKYYILVDGASGARGNFTLSITPPSPDACLGPTVIPATGGTFTGTTSGSSSQAGSCASTASAPEKVFQWTPATSGAATIQTCGSSFNTALYLRGGSCGTGSQLSCNDNTGGCPGAGVGNYGSRIRPSVTAGQTYYIVVDGANGGAGNFSLSVIPPP